jgi:hypothetical protein
VQVFMFISSTGVDAIQAILAGTSASESRP